MSAIDQYTYTCLGIVRCPSTYRIVYLNDDAREIPLYRLNQAIPADETDFRGKKGDILLGGGSGEAAALCLAIPEAFLFWTHEDWCDYDTLDEIIKAYWTPTQAYVFGEGYSKLGWIPKNAPLEWWLAQHILNFLACNYPNDYRQYVGPVPLEEDGAVCRLPTNDELARLHPPRYVVRRMEPND